MPRVAAAQEDPTIAPVTTLSADGRTGTDGRRTLTVSTVVVPPEGATLSVYGSGYNEEKGIYVAFCVVPTKNQMPSPCGGGVNLDGTGGGSTWISSNPPSYGQGLAIPYGPGGSFSAQVQVQAILTDGIDCRVVTCAVITRSDHTRLSDRSQDIIIPLRFVDPTPTPVPPTATATPQPGQPTQPPATATATATNTTEASATPESTATPSATAVSAGPTVTLSSDGLTATAGGKTLRASNVRDIAPGAEVTVRGEGFDDSRGIYVALCALPESTNKPAPCSAGSQAASAWISSNPPDYAKDLAKPYSDGGSFEVTLKLNPKIDGRTDCTAVRCAIATRTDDNSPGDPADTLYLPVSFSSGAEPTTASATQPSAAQPTGDTEDSDGGTSMPPVMWLLIGGGVLAIVVVGGFVLRGTIAGSALAVIAVALLLGSCGGSGSASDDDDADNPSDVPSIVVGEAPQATLPVTVTSSDGREVTITDTTRIVSLWGNITEVVYGLGLGENVVGRDITATFPEAEDVPVVTRAHDVSAESVLSLRPTVVLASEDTGPADALQHIRNVGVPVVQFEEPTSIDDIPGRIRSIAAALGVPEAGEALVERTQASLAEAKTQIPSDHDDLRVGFLYLRGQAGVYLLGGKGSGADSMIRAADAIDAGTDIGLDNPFTPITSEALVKAAPDVILMTTTGLKSVGGVDGLVKIPGIAQTPAGKNRRVVTLDDALLYSFGPRSAAALELLIEQLYGNPATQ